jgi:hypothetical protein
MPKQNWKRPNAYKHGIFSATAILPGEDEQEFERLHADLIEEWKPVGATEEDTVHHCESGVAQAASATIPRGAVAVERP